MKLRHDTNHLGLPRVSVTLESVKKNVHGNPNGSFLQPKLSKSLHICHGKITKGHWQSYAVQVDLVHVFPVSELLSPRELDRFAQVAAVAFLQGYEKGHREGKEDVYAEFREFFQKVMGM